MFSTVLLRGIFVVLIVFIACSQPIVSVAQQPPKQGAYSIRGAVFDQSLKPMHRAVVRVLSVTDSSLVQGVNTQPDGSFLIGKLAAGTYLVDVRYVGYARYVSAPVQLHHKQPASALDSIILKEEATTTADVTVTASQNYMEREIDRTIINVDAQIVNAGRTILEVLENTPGIIIDRNGGITMKGKPGVVVLIDDKPTYMAGNDLQNYLQSLPAGMAQQIELIPNPPAMYDAAGTAGIINIRMKRIQVGGLVGNVVLNYNQGRYARSNNALNLTLNREDFSIFANAGAGVQNVFQDLTIYRNYLKPDGSPLSSFTQNSIIRKQALPVNLRIGADWYLSKNTTLGVSGRGVYQRQDATTTNTAQITLPDGRLVNTVTADNSNAPYFRNILTNINLRHRFDTLGTMITVDGDYVWYNTTDEQRFVNNVISPDRSASIRDELTGSLPARISIYAVKTDFTKSLASLGMTLQAGAKAAFTGTDNTAAYSSVIRGTAFQNDTLSNRFLYDELITAAYLNLNGSLFDVLEFQAGLRVENTAMNGTQVGNSYVPASTFRQRYTNFFPTIFLQSPLDSAGQHYLNLTAGRRISRPIYQNLNPFISPLDKFTFYTGNPFLVPSFSSYASLTHTWANAISTTLEFSRETDGVNETIELQDSIYFSRPKNITTFNQFSLQVSAGAPVTDWWTANLTAEGGLMSFSSTLYGNTLNASRWYFSANIQQAFTLSDTWSAELSGNGRTSIAYAQLILGGVWQLNFAIQKKLFDGKASLKLAFNDIFFTQKPFGTINNLANATAGWNSILDTRQVALTFSFRFGSTNVKREQYNGNGSESERQRVKQG